MVKKGLSMQMFSALAAIVTATVIICLCAATCSGGKLDFKATYYFVCYRMTDNAISADAISKTVSSYGGAGYILPHGGNYYVTLSCYYKSDEADSVCAKLKERDLECSVLKIETKQYRLQGSNAKKNEQLYLGNLKTLNSLSALAYECANGLDTGSLSQSKAKQLLTSITDSLNGLLKNNPANCFTQSLQSAVEECKNVSGGFLLSKNMRYIQIALADRIINAELN